MFRQSSTNPVLCLSCCCCCCASADIDACQYFSCVNGAESHADATCQDLVRKNNNTDGYECKCPIGFAYDVFKGCQSKAAACSCLLLLLCSNSGGAGLRPGRSHVQHCLHVDTAPRAAGASQAFLRHQNRLCDGHTPNRTRIYAVTCVVGAQRGTHQDVMSWHMYSLMSSPKSLLVCGLDGWSCPCNMSCLPAPCTFCLLQTSTNVKTWPLTSVTSPKVLILKSYNVLTARKKSQATPANVPTPTTP